MSRADRLAVLVIGFNRPDLLEQVFMSLVGKPRLDVFVSIDGPRSNVPEDFELVRRCRGIADDYRNVLNIRHVNASLSNNGCRVHVQRAVDWFFTEVDEGVILEDDCVPGPEFLAFAAEMLHKWRDVPKVMHIAGDNSFYLRCAADDSYGFSDRPLIWGWATWKNRWALCDQALISWPTIRGSEVEKQLWSSRRELKARRDLLDAIYTRGIPDTWDAQWVYSVRMMSGLCVVPRANLVTNIGFREDGTHTRNPQHPRAAAPVGQVFPLVHPKTMASRMNRRYGG